MRKEYNMEEYEKLDKADTQTYDEPIISVRGKVAPKEALMEIAKRTGGKLYDEHVDIFDRKNDKIYDARICSKCGTEFGFVKIRSSVISRKQAPKNAAWIQLIYIDNHGKEIN